MPKRNKKEKPIATNENVEFSSRDDDQQDLNALQKARKTDERAKGSE